MLETKMYEKLKKIIKDRTFLQRIENRTGKVPDIYFANKYKNGWIELKNIKSVSRKGIVKIPFRPGQFAWIKKHLGFNSDIILICTIGKQWFIKFGHFIKEEYNISELELFNKLSKSIIEITLSI